MDIETEISSDKRRVLKEVFGFEAFRPGQEPVVDALLAGRNILAVMPTGAGKSLCFQVPALVIQGRSDPYGTLAQVREVETRSLAPVDAVMLEDCRHAPHFDQPEATLGVIADFATRIGNSTAEQAEAKTA